MRVVTPGSEAPLGIFDSGFGGLTVAREIADQLPGEDLVYLCDTARAPYGDQAFSEIREAALECCDHLVSRGVKMLVIACNTATSVMLPDARERYDVPVVGVVVPPVLRAVAASRNRRIGVLCTRATAASDAYAQAMVAALDVTCTTVACPGLVELVEAGVTSGPEVEVALAERLAPIREAGCDTVILGCTHYPLLRAAISYQLGAQVTLVSSSSEAAKTVFAELSRTGALAERREAGKRAGQWTFLTTGSPERFEGIGHRLIGDFVAHVEQFTG